MKLFNKILTYVILVSVAILILFPVFVNVMSAFNDLNTLSSSSLIPKQFTLNNFKLLFTGKYAYTTWYFNTFFIATVVMVISTIMVTINGYIYSRMRFKSRKAGMIAFLAIQILPAGSTLIALYTMADALGVYASPSKWPAMIFLIVIYINGSIPMNTLLIKGYYDTIPRELDESAKIDGASDLRIFVQILLPLIRPMVAVVGLFTFMGPIGDIILPKIIMTNQAGQTLAVGLQTMVNDPTNSSYSLYAAGSILVAIPILILFFILQRNLVSGLSSGGVKG